VGILQRGYVSVNGLHGEVFKSLSRVDFACKLISPRRVENTYKEVFMIA
jgi:hypothetical protein